MTVWRYENSLISRVSTVYERRIFQLESREFVSPSDYIIFFSLLFGKVRFELDCISLQSVDTRA